MELTKFLDLPKKMDETTFVLGEPGILIFLALAFVAYKVFMFIYERKRGQASYRFASENQNTLVSLTDSLSGLESRMSRIDQGLDSIIKRIDQLQLAQYNNGDLQQAQQLVQDGASTEQIIELCGLSRGEAELFQRLHA